MPGRRVLGVPLARGGSVPVTVVGRAQVRSSFDHTPGIRLVGSEVTCCLLHRILRDTAGSHRCGVLHPLIMTRKKMISCPFPHVSGHVEEAVTVGAEPAYRGCSVVSVQSLVLPRKLTLPDVAPWSTIRFPSVSPGVGGLVQAAASSELPFGLGWNFLAGPLGVGADIEIGHMRYGMEIALSDVAAWTSGRCQQAPGI